MKTTVILMGPIEYETSMRYCIRFAAAPPPVLTTASAPATTTTAAPALVFGSTRMFLS